MSERQPAVERRVVSILFADLVGFTALSENLDAEEVAGVQDEYFASVRATVERYAGRLEKFIGDAAMAVFGVPRAAEDDAERAVRAGLALVSAVETLSARLGLDEAPLQLRVGVNTGEVAYTPGDGGEWRVSGDSVNTAARLQAAAGPGTVLVGDATALTVAETIVLDAPAELSLKGKVELVRAWRAVTPLPERSRERAMGHLRAPLLGREREMTTISEALSAATAGTARGLLLLAPPGAGKTRLLNEAAEAVGDNGGLVLARARVAPNHGTPAAAVSQLLLSAAAPAGEPQVAGRQVAQQIRAAGDAEAAHAAAEVERLFGIDTGIADRPVSAADAGDERALRFRLWLHALNVVAAGRRQLWLVEDLHWAGGDLIALLLQAAVEAAPGGRLVLASARPVLLERLAGQPIGGVEVVELPPLDSPDVAELVRALVGEALPPEIVRSIVGRADGNPLFVEELLRTWISLGTLTAASEGAWQLSAPVEAVSVPQTIQQIYAAQLDDLPDNARALIRRASVAGRHVPRHSLESLDVADTEATLSIARRRALLADAPPDRLAGPLLTFRHALLRDAGYSSLARADRARLHARLAAWYEVRGGPRADELAEQIARHYGAAVDNASRLSHHLDAGLEVARARELATEWHERAAAHALAGASHDLARSLLREALRHASAAPAVVRGRLLLALGEATAYTSDMQAGASILEESLEQYSSALDGAATDPERRAARNGHAAAAAALGRVWIQQVRFEDAGRLADRGLAMLADDEDDERAAAPLLGIRSWVKATMTRDASVIVDLERAVGIARRSGDRRLEAELLDWRASALGELGVSALDDWRRLERLVVDAGDWRRAVKAMRTLASFYVDDEHEKVWQLADQAEEIARRRGLEEDLCWIDYLRAEAGFAAGDWDRAMLAGRRAVELGERNSYDRVVVRTIHVLLPIATARGDAGAAEQPCRWHEERRELFPDSPYARIMEAAIDLHCAAAGFGAASVPEPAPRLASFDGEPGGPSWLAALEAVVESWLAAGEISAADDAVARMEAGADGAPETSALGRGTAAYLRARVLVARHRPGDAERSARAALAHFRVSRAQWWIAKTLRLLSLVDRATPGEQVELDSLSADLRLAG